VSADYLKFAGALGVVLADYKGYYTRLVPSEEVFATWG